MTYQLRPAVSADAGACANILRDWIDETHWFRSPHPASSDQAFVAGKITGSCVVVVHFFGHMAGFLSRESDTISCLYVARLHRGRGAGKLLVDDAKADHPACLQLWTFQANIPARNFYEREGFVAANKTDGDNEEGLPDVRYVWSSKDNCT